MVAVADHSPYIGLQQQGGLPKVQLSQWPEIVPVMDTTPDRFGQETVNSQ
jgi:hypothetical protein